MMRYALFLSLVGIACAASAQTAQQTQRAKLTDTNVLLKAPKIDAKQMHPCQPLKGEVVEMLEVKTAVDGMPGVDMARVRVVGGRCDGQEGWVGTPRLEATRP